MSQRCVFPFANLPPSPGFHLGDPSGCQPAWPCRPISPSRPAAGGRACPQSVTLLASSTCQGIPSVCPVFICFDSSAPAHAQDIPHSPCLPNFCYSFVSLDPNPALPLKSRSGIISPTKPSPMIPDPALLPTLSSTSAFHQSQTMNP